MFKIYISDNFRELLIQLKNLIYVFLLMVDFVFIFIITFFNVSYNQLSYMVSFDLFICILLFIHLCSDYINYDKGFLSFIKEHFFDILSIIPFDFIFLRFLAIYRIIRCLQFLQVFKLFRAGTSLKESIKYFVQNRLLKLLVIILFIYILFASVMLTNIDSSFSTVFEAFWFNVVTMTSVGYGDFTPVTNPGRVLAMCSIIMGIGFVSIFTAAMSSVYMEKPEEETRRHVKKYINRHIKHIADEKKVLNEKIDELKKQNEELNKKLDLVVDLLDKEE